MPRRVTSWLIIIWSAIFLIWIIGGIATRPSQDCAAGDQFCQDASDAGTGIGVVLLIVLWFIGFVVLALIWLMTRKRGRTCPACGTEARRGETVCRSCGYSFADAAGHGPAASPTPAAPGTATAAIAATPSPAPPPAPSATPAPPPPEPQPEAEPAAPEAPAPADPDPATPGVPAGWYPDPLGRHPYRWWDGARWTDDVGTAERGTALDPLPAGGDER